MTAAFRLNIGAEVGLHHVTVLSQFSVEHRVELVSRVAVLGEDSVPELRPLVDKQLTRGPERFGWVRDVSGEENIRDLDEVSLLPAFPILDGGGKVSVHRAGGLHSDLRVLVDVEVNLLGLEVVETVPGGGDQDVDIVDTSPALAGGVQHPAALTDPGLDVLNDLLGISL